MKILYGIQSVGNGHISRARLFVPALRKAGADVDCLFSGRPPEEHFDMNIFGQSLFLDGLRLIYQKGKLSSLKTAFDAVRRLPRVLSDVTALNLEPYDLILCDSEPISSLAAARSGKPCIDISNINALKYDVPKPDVSFLEKVGLKSLFMTSSRTSLGMHWSHFNQQNIIPPFVVNQPEQMHGELNKILVYLNFEDLQDIRNLLSPFSNSREFFIYSPDIHTRTSEGHLHFKPFSREDFQNDIDICGKVIANAGFSLSTEALQAGKPLLVKPMEGQPEQIANAMALNHLNLAATMNSLDKNSVRAFLEDDIKYNKISFPDTATALANWIVAQDYSNNRIIEIQPLIDDLWTQVERRPA